MDTIKKGFYYHYKHDPSGEINNYAEEVMGTALHTEEGKLLVIYRPLYKSDFLGSADYFARPAEMFLEIVEKNCEKFSRFKLITDEKVIAKLRTIKDGLYKE
ncbi:MAG: DUF1653 domain-containing protein [Candidatus Pacebacteria bacterium]|nr:DUF1653 domain-containing protein [Candidatus Paceibacterota bacterium]